MVDKALVAAIKTLWQKLEDEDRTALIVLAACITLKPDDFSVTKIFTTRDLNISPDILMKLTKIGFLTSNGSFVTFASNDILNFVKNKMSEEPTE